ncbi:MAG TPA: TolC family protein [Gemmatimonadales bacterium]
MRRSRLVLACCALPLAALPVGAQQRSLTLAEALKLAEQAAPAVVQARGNARSAGAGVRAAWGEFLPSISSTASYGKSSSDGPSRTDPITGEVISGNASSSSLSVGGSASIDLFTGFRRGADLDAARAGRTEADAALAFEQSESARLTTNQFLQALQGADLVRVRQDAIRRAQEKLAIANAKLSTRSITIADSLQAVVDLTSARLNLLSEERNLTEAEANLARLVGLDGRVSAVADSSLFRIVPVTDSAQLMSEAMERSPSVIRAGAQVNTARANLSITRSAYLPRVSVSTGTSFSGSDRNDYALFNNRNVNLQLSWQLFNGFARERDVAVRQASLDAALAREGDARRQIGATLTAQLAALGSAEQRMALTAENLESARASVRVQTERYRLGSIGIVELNAAQDALSRAETDAVSARYEYLRAKAQIEAILGRPL